MHRVAVLTDREGVVHAHESASARLRIAGDGPTPAITRVYSVREALVAMPREKPASTLVIGLHRLGPEMAPDRRAEKLRLLGAWRRQNPITQLVLLAGLTEASLELDLIYSLSQLQPCRLMRAEDVLSVAAWTQVLQTRRFARASPRPRTALGPRSRAAGSASRKSTTHGRGVRDRPLRKARPYHRPQRRQARLGCIS